MPPDDPDWEPEDDFEIAPRVKDQLSDSRLQNLQNKLTENDIKNLVKNPNAQRFLDNNTGHINVIQNVEGVNLRITLTNNPSAPRIISVGPIRINQITNGIANGRFVPLK